MSEIPPTNGLPLRAADFALFGGDALEAALSRMLRVPVLPIVSSGTAALIIALRTLSKHEPQRKVVVISGYTCPLVAIAVSQANLQIRLCDTAPDSYDFDEASLAQACQSDVLAVIATHFGGIPAKLESVCRIANAAGAKVIEDVAQSLGSMVDGAVLGTIGDIGMFSLSVGKGLTVYEGGFLTAKEPALQADLLQETKTSAPLDVVREGAKCCELLGYALFYNPDGLRHFYGKPLRQHLKNNQRAEAVGDVFPLSVPVHVIGSLRKRVGLSALQRLPAHLSQSAERAAVRRRALACVSHIKLLGDEFPPDTPMPFFTIVFPTVSACERVLNKLWSSGLGVTKLFAHALTGYEYLKEIVPRASLPNAESFAARTLTVTNSAYLTDDQFETIVQTMQSCIAAEFGMSAAHSHQSQFCS